MDAGGAMPTLGPKAKGFLSYTIDQRLLLPPDLREWLPEGQGYNAQIAVDEGAHIIVACDVTQQTNDKRQLVPMAAHVVAALGRLADVTTADAGYFSEAAVDDPSLASTDLLVPPHRQEHGTPSMEPCVAPAANASAKDRTRHKLTAAEGHARYRMRKAIVEPVSGQIKEARGFRPESSGAAENRRRV
jgi:NAD(P)-dependent dehydrogenase (short-subunit alcohol dehydrogenase family)